MAPWQWALIVVILVVLVAAVLFVVNRRRRSVTLQQRFGPEYDRTVQSADDRRSAEAALEDRARRRAQLHVVPLAEPVRLRYADEWRGLQEQFVDRPVDAVAGAETLVTRVMNDRGYPVGEFEQQAELISVDHPHVVENYRVAHEIHGRTGTGQAGTEDLREAMLRYRSLFDDLLRPGQNGHDPDGAAPADDAAHPHGRHVVPPDAVLGKDVVGGDTLHGKDVLGSDTAPAPTRQEKR